MWNACGSSIKALFGGTFSAAVPPDLYPVHRSLHVEP
jgi:hypothetical protein